jgi:LacI family transcriptional regulator
MPLTLEDIARSAGVSRSTVSRVINGDPKVSPATREHVLEILNRVNFQPNLAARGLANGRTSILGLVIPAGVAEIFADPYFPLLIQGVNLACNARDYSVMLWLAEPEYERRMINRILHNGLVDGVIVSSTLMDDPLVQALHASKLPFILAGHHPFLEVNSLDVDNRAGGQAATAHLLRLGRQRIATITGPRNMFAGEDRYQGYLDALRQRGVPIRPELVVEGDFTEGGGFRGMQALLAQGEVDAVFAASDQMAYGALRALHAAGRRVPEDVAVVGFDDLPPSAHTDPPLTTVRQPIQRMGALVAETLIDLIRHPNPQPRHTVLPTELVIRASCGA